MDLHAGLVPDDGPLRPCLECTAAFWTLEAEVRRKIGEGYVNFATSLNDCILVFAIEKYLLREGGGFYITRANPPPSSRYLSRFGTLTYTATTLVSHRE